MRYYLQKTVSITTVFLLIIFFTRFFVLDPGRVEGQSMEPKFGNKELFFINKITPLLRPLKRFDVVQFMNPINQDHLVIKRIVGMPGETVSFKRNTVFVRDKNGTEHSLIEPYLYPNMAIEVKYGAKREFKVPPDSYFMLGDNRPISADSREFGPIHRRNIIGKVIAW